MSIQPSDRAGKGWWSTATGLPEANVGLFAFLVHYPWEFLQVPFYEDMPAAKHWDAVVFCTQATAGDAAIAVSCFWVVALCWRDRHWLCRPRIGQIGMFIAVGIAVTIVLEWHATAVAGRWAYADAMPVVPVLGTGLAPLLQWLMLPPLMIWLVRRQLLGHSLTMGR
jgi:hypothetical protein